MSWHFWHILATHQNILVKEGNHGPKWPKTDILLNASSVARGGAGGARASPIGLWNMQNRTFLVLLRPSFGEKLKTAPPPKEIGCRSCEVHIVIRLKKRLNFRFQSKNQSQFRWRRSFFLETTCFWAEKTFEFPSFPRNSLSIFGQTVWFWFKNNENSGQGRFHFSHSFKKAPPPFSKSWLRACLMQQSI